MATFRRKDAVVEAITFEELVAHGIASGGVVLDGIPWSFEYAGLPVTHESDDCYLIATAFREVRFERGDMLVSPSKGEVYACTPHAFEARFEAKGPDADGDRIDELIEQNRALSAANQLLREQRDNKAAQAEKQLRRSFVEQCIAVGLTNPIARAQEFVEYVNTGTVPGKAS